MADKDENETQDVELQGLLAKRLLVAGALVGVLLATLAFFDYLATREEAPDPPVFTQPVPVPPKKAMSQPVTPVTDLPPPPAPTEPVAVPPPAAPTETPPAPEVAAKPALPAAPVETTAPPAAPVKPVPAKPVEAAPAPAPAPPASKPAKPVEITPRPVPQTPPAVPEGTSAPDAPKPSAVVLPKPVEPAKPALQPVAPAPRLFSGYVVQAGVFSSTKAAEELHARLTLNGIPSTLEARVQVGPFKNKEEAEAARQKLKALGIEGLMLPPAGRR